MPTPLDILLDPISLVVFAMYGGLMLWEALLPGRSLPKAPYWPLRGIAMFFVFLMLSAYLPLLWNDWLAPLQLLDLTVLGTVGGTVAGLLVYEVGAWLWHRTMHAVGPLWRMHQMHHSAERLDTFSAFWFHPLDAVGWTALASLSLVLLIGITPQAATYVLLLTTFMTIFQHTNVKTPRWLGYLVQRPESHTVHHATGLHRSNYADLPIVDILFGTFENPRTYEHETGLHPGASARLLELLTLRDVSAPKTQPDVASAERRSLVDSTS